MGIQKTMHPVKFIRSTCCPFPLYSCAVSAGFPSPADDHIERSLDLNEYVIQNPAATFFAKASGDSMEPGGIFDGDLLVIDRSIKPKHGRVVVAAVNGEMLVKRYLGSVARNIRSESTTPKRP